MMRCKVKVISKKSRTFARTILRYTKIMAAKPCIPKGTRDFSPVEMAKRNYIFDTIRSVYHLYGFQQIETPAMEMLSTLMGKYGEEGDKLLFKIQNSGDCWPASSARRACATTSPSPLPATW